MEFSRTCVRVDGERDRNRTARAGETRAVRCFPADFPDPARWRPLQSRARRICAHRIDIVCQRYEAGDPDHVRPRHRRVAHRGPGEGSVDRGGRRTRQPGGVSSGRRERPDRAGGGHGVVGADVWDRWRHPRPRRYWRGVGSRGRLANKCAGSVRVILGHPDELMIPLGPLPDGLYTVST